MQAERSRRADAERNIAAIVAAGLEVFATKADASMADVATAAGVGRVTIYGHFANRAALVEAVVARATEDAEAALGGEDLDALPAGEALAVLVRTSWQSLDRIGRLRAAAVAELAPARLRELHDRPLEAVARLIARGQKEGAIRTDLPKAWLVTTFYALLHAASDDVAAGRLAAKKATAVLEATLASALGIG